MADMADYFMVTGEFMSKFGFIAKMKSINKVLYLTILKYIFEICTPIFLSIFT